MLTQAVLGPRQPSCLFDQSHPLSARKQRECSHERLWLRLNQILISLILPGERYRLLPVPRLGVPGSNASDSVFGALNSGTASLTTFGLPIELQSSSSHHFLGPALFDRLCFFHREDLHQTQIRLNLESIRPVPFGTMLVLFYTTLQLLALYRYLRAARQRSYGAKAKDVAFSLFSVFSTHNPTFWDRLTATLGLSIATNHFRHLFIIRPARRYVSSPLILLRMLKEGRVTLALASQSLLSHLTSDRVGESYDDVALGFRRYLNLTKQQPQVLSPRVAGLALDVPKANLVYLAYESARYRIAKETCALEMHPLPGLRSRWLGAFTSASLNFSSTLYRLWDTETRWAMGDWHRLNCTKHFQHYLRPLGLRQVDDMFTTLAFLMATYLGLFVLERYSARIRYHLEFFCDPFR